MDDGTRREDRAIETASHAESAHPALAAARGVRASGGRHEPALPHADVTEAASFGRGSHPVQEDLLTLGESEQGSGLFTQRGEPLAERIHRLRQRQRPHG